MWRGKKNKRRKEGKLNSRKEDEQKIINAKKKKTLKEEKLKN